MEKEKLMILDYLKLVGLNLVNQSKLQQTKDIKESPKFIKKRETPIKKPKGGKLTKEQKKYNP